MWLVGPVRVVPASFILVHACALARSCQRLILRDAENDAPIDLPIVFHNVSITSRPSRRIIRNHLLSQYRLE